MNNLNTIPIKGVLQLSVRPASCLKKAGIETIGQLLRLSDSDLIKIPRMGRTSVNEIKDELEKVLNGTYWIPICPHCDNAILSFKYISK